VNLLLASGANVDAIDNDGDTPLLHAARKGNTNILKALLNAGASLVCNGRNIVDIAKRKRFKPAIISILAKTNPTMQQKRLKARESKLPRRVLYNRTFHRFFAAKELFEKWRLEVKSFAEASEDVPKLEAKLTDVSKRVQNLNCEVMVNNLPDGVQR
jgi:ankyrin repeat protein